MDIFFKLSDELPKVLKYESEREIFILSSDSISHSYSKVKSMSEILKKISSDEIESFYKLSSTIGAYIIFLQLEFKIK